MLGEPAVPSMSDARRFGASESEFGASESSSDVRIATDCASAWIVESSDPPSGPSGEGVETSQARGAGSPVADGAAGGNLASGVRAVQAGNQLVGSSAGGSSGTGARFQTAQERLRSSTIFRNSSRSLGLTR